MNAIHEIDARRESLASLIPAVQKSELGQFMTPSVIAGFMAGMFSESAGKDIRLLDAGAGIGSLTAAFVTRLGPAMPRSLQCVAWEIDPLMRLHLAETLAACDAGLSSSPVLFSAEVREEDFILAASSGVRYGTTPRFTHAILNPPYRKLSNDSAHRRALRSVGIETSNQYAAFVGLALLMLEDGGELVAITPRSFCNGTYFKTFRAMLFEMAALAEVHLFESRNHAFKGDAVLQENIIFRLVKGAVQGDVRVSTSSDATFSDRTVRQLPFSEIIVPGDDERLIHLPADDEALALGSVFRRFPHTLKEIGIGVSTGPVVDFRLRAHLRMDVGPDCVPLVYCLHFEDGYVVHPKPNRKANALAVNHETEKWLMPSGHYVCVRRLSSKEEKRRIVPALFDPERIASARVAFDNHLNVFHESRQGMSPRLARGLAIYLGSSLVDRWFRRFNGHTQVNAGDLRALRYPERATLESWGERAGKSLPSQAEIDCLVEGRAH